MSKKYAEGCIEKREVLADGSLPQGERDADKPRRLMYFAMITHPYLWYGELRNTAEEAVEDGKRHLEGGDYYVPCFTGYPEGV